MGAEMRLLRFTKLLIVAFIFTTIHATDIQDGSINNEGIRPARIERDLDGVTTVLLVPARPGKSIPPVGLLTKTARTFVQDGASTEYATQVLGTTLDNGRLYARILSTSSRIFYDKEPSPDPTSAYLVYPSRAQQEDLKVTLENSPISAIERYETSASQSVSESKTEEKNNLSENDVLGEHDLNDDSQIFKPAKVRPADDLPTYTVKQEYVSRIASETFEDDQQKNFRPRAPKIFKSPPKVSAKKPDPKSLSTVTYHGFADFTTTVGDTVIVFSPSTAPAPVGRPATTIKGDATLRPDDGIAVLKIRPTNVVGRKTELPQNRNRPQGFPPRNLGAKSNEDIFTLQPSIANEDSGHVEPTSPLLLDLETNSLKPTGLLKVIDSTTSLDGTTTHYKSSIYGTYVGTNYAQIVHTSSNVYYFPDESSASFDETTTRDYATTETDTEEYVSTTEESLTTLQETTENVPTTPRFRLRGSARLRPKLRPAKTTTTTTPASTDDDTANAILSLDPQGRSIKHQAPRNQIPGKNQTSKSDKVSLATRLLPSTIFKTFTYFTTFFIPGKNDQTTTSVKTREAVSSEVTYLTELIQPTASQIGSTSTKILENSSIQKQEDQEIELIFKTLYTTYTYLTTFFQESTSSVSSREVVETNVITQTLGPNGASVDINGLFDESESIFIAPTRVAGESPSTKAVENKFTTENPLLPSTEDTTLMEEATTPNGILSQLEPSEVGISSTKSYEKVEKTYYTTYTYFTTIFVEDETEIETRTEVFTNIVTEKIQPTSVQVAPSKSEQIPPPEILAYLEALKRQKSQEEAKEEKKDVKKLNKPEEEEVTTPANDYFTTEGITDLDTDVPTTFESSTEQMHVKPNTPIDGEVLGSMITDVISSSSSGGGTLLDVAERRNIVPEDQELSESNHHEVEPVPTLLLQTSYTTFTYFTTMYKGDESNVVSRLETVTNVVTETIKPTAVLSAESSSTLPVTYFTTFTYWTTFYKGGDTITTSREEIVSNVVEPGIAATPTIELGSVMTYRPDISDSPSYQNVDKEKVTADNEVASFVPVFPEKPSSKINIDNTWNGIETIKDSASSVEPLATVALDPTTFYTTYTYFTTSYVGDSTVLNSRLETVTSVYYPEDADNVATGRAIGGAIPTVQVLGTNEKALNEIAPSKASGLSKTGLLSTVRSSHVADGTTTHYLTDVYGTYIDGLYAQVEQSSTKLETPKSSTATPVLPTGVLSLNMGSIVDADKVSTVFFTTKQIGTLIDGLYAKVIESTSSTKIDEAKLATHSPVHGHRTGLVRLIQGNIVANGTSVFYESKVIGTSIEGRYAQIIESTSSYLTSPTVGHNLAPTATLKPNHATGIHISPSPAVIQSSLSEDPTANDEDDNQEREEEDEDGEDDEEDEDGQKNTKKSRLTFSSRKRTFTPVIRPFASRNRPTFNPKRKNAQGATTITRTDVTPTVTATLAGKGNRYASSRVRVTSPIGPYSSTLSPSNSRRFAGRRISPTSTLSSSGAPAGSTRGRSQSRITPSSSFSANRRGPSSIRGSSARPASRIASSSVFPGASSRYRPGIRPSSTLAKVTPTSRQDDQEDNANEFTATTLVTEETPYTLADEDLTTIQTTTESPRRSTNPLLRFRSRPLLGNVSPRGTTAPRSTTPAAPRRPNNLTRQNGVVSRARANVRPTTPLPSTRPRQGQTGLFPPRGLFGKKPEPTEGVTESINEASVSEHSQHLEDIPVEEIADNDYEGSEHEETAPARNSSRTAKSFKQPVQIRPFGYGRNRRVRRQASQLRAYSNRARRPSSQSSGYLEDRIDSDAASSDEDFSKTNSKYNSKYANRGRSLNVPRPSITGKKPIDNSESSEVNNLRSRTKPTPNRGTSPRVKPSPVSGLSRQFTLREKDTGTTRSSYKRPTTSGTRRVDTRSRTSSRLRGSSRDSSRRLPSSRSSSRNSGRGSNNRRLPSRSRGGPHEDFREAGFVYPEFDGTITVTHYVPVEVTIPYVTNGITEKRNIITAQPSTQVLAPELYSTVLSGDGNPLVVINSQNTGTNAQGQVEVTRFLLHEKPTTRVSYTLTSLGGRRASQSVIIPSTIYSVENIISTVQPSLPGANSPLANILLSQLLLGQLGQQNPLLGGMTTPATPTTRFDTRTTTYVTTITKLQSTIIPLTFRGKEILTTLVESSSDVVTATEFITDTVVVTPTAAIPQANLNSLLYLLQQPQNPQQPNPLLDPLFAAAPASQSNTLPGEVERRNQPVDADYKSENYDDSSEEETESKSRRYKISSKSAKKDTVAPAAPESSVVTLYVSGRRPGEFSTVLSTVKIGEETTTPRRRRDVDIPVEPSVPPTLQGVSESEGYILSGSEEPANPHAPTQSLESVVGDVGRHISTSIYT